MTFDGRIELVEIDDANAPFIVFDGIDGSGKSTLVDATAHLLDDRGFDVEVTRSPPREAVERPLYLRYLYDPSSRDEIDYRGLIAVLMGERLQHAHEVLVPALRSGIAVVCNRYIYSAAAHLLARGYPHEPWFLDLSTHLPRPTVAFHLTAPLGVLLARLSERGNGPDAHVEDGYFGILHRAYRSVARTNGLISLDTTDDIESTLEQIDNEIDSHVERRIRRRPRA